MQETVPSAFLSYTHRDDQQEDGKLRQLAKLLQGEVEVRLGRKFDLFVDKEKLSWGGALEETNYRVPEQFVVPPTHPHALVLQQPCVPGGIRTVSASRGAIESG